MYIPRSGALRKVKYAMPIFKEEELPKKDLKDVLKIAQELRQDADLKMDLSEVEDKKKKKKVSKNPKKTKEQCEPSDVSAALMQKKNLDENTDSVVPDDVYDALYPANVKLSSFPFPVKTGPGKECTKISSGCDDASSDYDMDSEDEEWLNQHQEYNITPNRLEYIFTQLNKRNTHVPGKAITALRASYRGDFGRVFPYWKEKRRFNRNLSTFKPKINCTRKEAKNFGVDPYLVFLSNPEKISVGASDENRTQSVTNPASFAELISKIKMLKDFRERAQIEISKGENVRLEISKNIHQFNERYQTLKNEHPSSDIDQNNNDASEGAACANAYINSSESSSSCMNTDSDCHSVSSVQSQTMSSNLSATENQNEPDQLKSKHISSLEKLFPTSIDTTNQTDFVQSVSLRTQFANLPVPTLRSDFMTKTFEVKL